jgi:FeS assembly SUF system protein
MSDLPLTNTSPPASIELLREAVVAAIRQVYDPEIPVNVYDLGLIYSVDVAPDYTVNIQMTLTAPTCPEAQVLPGQVEDAARSVAGVADAKVELVWDPPWTKERMSQEAMILLGLPF